MASGFSLDFYFSERYFHTQYKIEKLTSPNWTFPFDYNLLILPVDEEFKVRPTTFIVKILKSRGTSVY